MAMTAFQKTLKNHLGQTDVDPEVLQKAGVSQMGSQMSNANSAAAQATASAVKNTAQGAVGQANEALAAANAGKMQLGGAVPVNPDTPTNQIQPGGTQKSTGGKDYLMFGKPDAGFQSGMSAEDQTSWNAIGKKYAAGDNSWLTGTNPFREDGNWGSFYDDNGNINGWLYAANGTGGYAPVFGGKVGESGYKEGTVFFSPDGKAYTLGADGSLSQSGNVDWAQYGSYIGPKTGYQDSSFWALDENGQYKKYTNQTAPDSVLESVGYYRDENGLVRPINNDYYIAQGIKNGQITPEQAALANDWYWKANEPGGSTKIRDMVTGTAPGGGQVVNLPGDPNKPASIQNLPGDPNKPAGMQNLSNTAGNGGNAYPSGNGGGTNPSGSGFAPTTSFQDFLDQWDYGPPPEWTGSEHEQTESDILQQLRNSQWGGSEAGKKVTDIMQQLENMQWGGSEAGQKVFDLLQQLENMQWDGSEEGRRVTELLQQLENTQWTGSQYDQRMLELLEQSLQEYGGSKYDPMRDEYLQKYGEEYGGSEYLKKRDEHLQNAENMKWDYDPNTDPVWQALQKQYRREGDRATRQAMGQAAAMTGGMPSSYAMTAAAQAGNNYAAQLSDRLPQVYQDAYNRYLKEYERQMGLSDQYAGYDQTEYERWNDQQGRNLELANAYNLLSDQDRQAYKDRMDQLAGGAEAYRQLGQTEYNQFVDNFDRTMKLADAYNQIDQTKYNRFGDEYDRLKGLSDEYKAQDKTLYERWVDDYDRLKGLSDEYEGQDKTEYERWGDENDRQKDLAKTFGDLAQRDRDWYNEDRDRYESDRKFEYERLRDARSDYENDRDFNEDVRRYGMDYALKAQAQDFDQWYKQQGLSLDQAQMEFDQWYKQQGLSLEYEQMVFDQWYKEQVLGQNQQEIDNDKAYKEQQLGMQQQQFDYGKEQDAIDNEYRGNVFQQSVNEYDDQAEADAWNTFQRMGVAVGKVAEILGIEPGTTWEDYMSQYGGSQGGSSSPFTDSEIPNPDYTGGGRNPSYTPSPSPSPKGPAGGQYDETGKHTGTWKDSDGYTFNGYHPDGQPKSAGYNSTIFRIKSRASAGASKTEITQELIRLVDNRSITEYEANMILQELGWKTSSAGTGRNTIGPNNVQMVQ